LVLKLELGLIFRIGSGTGIGTRIGFSIPIMSGTGMRTRIFFGGGGGGGERERFIEFSK